jgi:hypothetical protein
MRIYEDNFAYEIEQVLDPATLVAAGWRYNVYRVRPSNELLHSGTTGSRETAEMEGRRAVQRVIQEAQKKKPAA